MGRRFFAEESSVELLFSYSMHGYAVSHTHEQCVHTHVDVSHTTVTHASSCRRDDDDDVDILLIYFCIKT